MPEYVATIEVFFDTESLAKAAEYADEMGDLLLDDYQDLRRDREHVPNITAVTTGVAPNDLTALAKRAAA